MKTPPQLKGLTTWFQAGVPASENVGMENVKLAPHATCMKTTPENITRLEAHQVFVFGSNYAGRHGMGAALVARRKFGAIQGQGMGLMGQSYGIATKGHQLEVLPLSEIEVQVDRFLRFAKARPAWEFLVTKIGCGLAGYSLTAIASLFEGKRIPPNVILPAEFRR